MGDVGFEVGMVNSILNMQGNYAMQLAYPDLVEEKTAYAYVSVLDGNGSVLKEGVFSSSPGVVWGGRQSQLDARWKDIYLHLAEECARESAKKKKRIVRLKKPSLVLNGSRFYAYGLYHKKFAVGVVTENAEVSRLLARFIKSILLIELYAQKRIAKSRYQKAS